MRQGGNTGFDDRLGALAIEPSGGTDAGQTRGGVDDVPKLFLEYLQASFEAGELAFFGSLAALAERIAFARRLTELRRVEWVVYAKRPFAGPDALLAYLPRSHRCHTVYSRIM